MALVVDVVAGTITVGLHVVTVDFTGVKTPANTFTVAEAATFTPADWLVIFRAYVDIAQHHLDTFDATLIATQAQKVIWRGYLANAQKEQADFLAEIRAEQDKAEKIL